MKTLPKSNIEYLTHHWPVVTGCSFGCPWCWARAAASRFPSINSTDSGAHPFVCPQVHPDRLDLPLRRKKPARIGVCFTGDLFGTEVPDKFRFNVLGRTHSAPQHTFFFLTKRAKEMQEFVATYQTTWLGVGFIRSWPSEYPNTWLGVSVTTPEEYRERVALLRATPAANRWVSYEPCLADPGQIDLDGISWLVIGSIDRPTAQYPAPRREWIDSIVDQCRAVGGVPVWVKNNAQHLHPATIMQGRKVVNAAWPQELPT